MDDLYPACARDVGEGRLPACQVALARDGRIVALRTFGDATDATRFAVFSVTKAITASALWLLLGERTVRLHDRVPEILDGFPVDVTLEQLMTHTAGFPNARVPVEAYLDRDARRRSYGRWSLEFEPGAACEYHGASADWVLADVIHATTGLDHRDFVRTRITDALGLPGLRLGMSPDEQTGLAEVRPCGEPMTPDELELEFGVRELPAIEATIGMLCGLNTIEARLAGIPGGGAFGTAADVALFYQALLRGDLWDADVLRDATGRVRVTMPDRHDGFTANRALGVVIAGDDGLSQARGFGRSASPRAFGHMGAGGQRAWADPETGVSFCYLTNGLERNVIRARERSNLIAELT